MKQFAGDMYREVRDAEGNVSQELTAFGEQLVKDATSAIGGMWDTITADGVIDPNWRGAKAVANARDYHRSVRSELSEAALRLSPGDPALPTVFR